MKKIAAIIGLLLLVLLGSLLINNSKSTTKEVKPNYMDFKLLSPVFQDNSTIPNKYTCDGENISPPLSITGVPENTKSLVLTVVDPDAPTKKWVHWVVWNINSNTTEILEGKVPFGAIQGTNDFNNIEYSGPCPPSGSHRYIFTLQAIDYEFTLAEKSSIEDLNAIIKDHVIASATLTGTYQRGQ
jgi:Raf kinase inhibitor-like YbhB/YbcL family protein